MRTPTRTPPDDPGRNDGTREKLLLAALELFGQFGFEATSTRQLATRAGVNLQAINYYFENKRGLYNAVADYLIERITLRFGERRQMVLSRLQQAWITGRTVEQDEAREILTLLAEGMLLMFTDEESAGWVRFMLREQAEPTEAYFRIYEGFMRPMLIAARYLVGVLMQESPDSERIRLRTLTLLGSLIIFRVGRATVLKELGWDHIGPDQIATIRGIAAELVASVRPVGEPQS